MKDNERNWFKDYFNLYNDSMLYENLDEDLILLKNLFLKSDEKGGKIVLFGNGGSAAMASHVSVDLVKNASIKSATYNEYDLITGKANYINFPLNDTWNTIEQSFRAVDSVLDFEKQLTLKWAEDRKYAYEKRGRITMKVYSRDFSNAYSDMLDGMQEKRIRASIKSIGSYWYTAWINAGQPNLTELYNNKSKIINLDEINEIENPKSNEVQIETRSHSN